MSVSNDTKIIEKCQYEVGDRFKPKKIQSLSLSEVYSYIGYDSKRDDFLSRADRVARCGDFLEFKLYDSGDSCLHRANFCRDRLCPMCNWRRSLKIFAQVSSCMDYLQNEGYRFIFLTLTVKNCSFGELGDTISALCNGWSKLIRRKIFKDNIKGYFRTLEITINNESMTFHPHIHCILAVKESYFHHDSFITHEIWRDLWAKSCDLDYLPMVNVKAVTSRNNGLSDAVNEVSKYVAKGCDYISDNFVEDMPKVLALADGIFHRRLCAFGGVFDDASKLLKLDDVEDGDLTHIQNDLRADVAFLIVRYFWRSGFTNYHMEVLNNE